MALRYAEEQLRGLDLQHLREDGGMLLRVQAALCLLGEAHDQRGAGRALESPGALINLLLRADTGAVEAEAINQVNEYMSLFEDRDDAAGVALSAWVCAVYAEYFMRLHTPPRKPPAQQKSRIPRARSIASPTPAHSGRRGDSSIRISRAVAELARQMGAPREAVVALCAVVVRVVDGPGAGAQHWSAIRRVLSDPAFTKRLAAFDATSLPRPEREYVRALLARKELCPSSLTNESSAASTVALWLRALLTCNEEEEGGADQELQRPRPARRAQDASAAAIDDVLSPLINRVMQLEQVLEGKLAECAAVLDEHKMAVERRSTLRHPP